MRCLEDGMESKNKPTVSGSVLAVHIDESGRQYVDPKDLVAQRSVRETLEKIQERFPHARRQHARTPSISER